MNVTTSKAIGPSSDDYFSFHVADQSSSSGRSSLSGCKTPEWFDGHKDPGSDFDWEAHDLMVYERERARYLDIRTPRSTTPHWCEPNNTPVVSGPSTAGDYWTGAPGYSQTLHQPIPVTPIAWRSVQFNLGYPSPTWSTASSVTLNE